MPPPPPEWVRASGTRDEPPQKRGAKEGHDAHYRPPPSRIDEEQEVTLPSSSKYGSNLCEAFARDEQAMETIAPGYVRGTRYHIARYDAHTVTRSGGRASLRTWPLRNLTSPGPPNSWWGTGR